MDKHLDRDYSLAEVCAATGKKPDAVQMMIYRGVLDTVDTSPGTGRRRRYRIAEIWKVALIDELVGAGFDQRDAQLALSNITSGNRHWWKRDPNAPLVLFILRQTDGSAPIARKCISQDQLNAISQDWLLERQRILPPISAGCTATILNVSKVLAPVDEALRSLPVNED